MEPSGLKGFFQNTFGQVVASLTVIIALGIGAAFFSQSPSTETGASAVVANSSSTTLQSEVGQSQLQDGPATLPKNDSSPRPVKIAFTEHSGTINVSQVMDAYQNKKLVTSEDDVKVSRTSLRFENESDIDIPNVTIELELMFPVLTYVSAYERSQKYLSDDIELIANIDRTILKVKNFYRKSFIVINSDTLEMVYYRHPKTNNASIEFEKINRE